MSHCDEHIENALRLAHELILLADAGDAVRRDVGCGVLFGALRDCAYKIQALARQELLEHQNKTNKKIGSKAETQYPPPPKQL